MQDKLEKLRMMAEAVHFDSEYASVCSTNTEQSSNALVW
jgi:hypothetical protein